MQITLEKFLEFTPKKLAPFIEKVSDSGYYLDNEYNFIQREILFYTKIKFNNNRMHGGTIRINKLELNSSKIPFSILAVKEEQLIITIESFLEDLAEQLK